MAHLDHIGIAVSENSKLAKLLKILSLPVSKSELVEGEKVSVDLIPLPKKDACIELLKPINKEGEIEKFLQKNKQRDGIHHLSFRVDDLEKTSLSLKQEGFSLIYEKPKEGANNCLVNFIHPKTTGGVLIEISQGK